MRKKVLICGATGFIGRNIAESFIQMSDVELFGTYHSKPPWNHPHIKMIQADLTNKDDVAKVISGKDIVIQAAATTSGAKDTFEKPYYHATDNAVMNSLIFRSAHENHVSQVVFFSCTVIYSSSELPLKESDLDLNKEFHSRYNGAAWTKVYIEKMCKFYSDLGRTKYTVLRHSNIYGPYDKFDLEKSHVFGASVAKVLSSTDGKVIVWGKGKEKRDLLYISDLVAFVKVAIEEQKEKFNLCNVGYGDSLTVSDLVSKIIKHSGKSIDIEYDINKPCIETNILLNINHAKEVFRWEPSISIDEGIKTTLNWYRQNY